MYSHHELAESSDVRRTLKNDITTRKRLYNIYIDMLCIDEPCFGIPEQDPIYCDSVDNLNKRISYLKNFIKNRYRSVKDKFHVSDEIRNAFMKGTQNEQFIMFHMLRNDYVSSGIKWVFCTTCNGMRLHNRHSNDDNVCDTCKKKKGVHQGMFPTWTDSQGCIHYDLPEELQDLTIAEKLLIQKRAVLLPIVHMQKNKFGLKGHAVMFEKNINDVCMSLPRTKVHMVYVVKEYTSSTSKEVCQANFHVRRDKVLKALVWLKKHHVGYSDISIDENNLSWMNDTKEMELSSSVITDHRVDIESKQKDEPTTVSEVQTQTEGDEFDFYSESTTNTEKKFDDDSARIIKQLRSECENAGKEFASIQFPFVNEKPVNEYNTQRLFADAYPWLFPGGVGDISDHQNGDDDLSVWCKLLHRWKDGRFMRDDFFTFHIQNFITRHNNNSFSLQFKKHILSDSQVTVDEIQDQIRKGDYSFIDKLVHFGGSKVKGSDGFWRNRKYELESWVTEMIESGKGPPTLFLTLSCAEYWWDELCQLLLERCKGTQDEKLCAILQNDKKNMKVRSFLIDKYTAVVQEYFQMKVENWLETVGKQVFSITGYYLRFEFAKGRGQIHAHILACTKDHTLILPFGKKWKEDKQSAVDFLSKFARDRLQMTCEKPSGDTCTNDCDRKSALNGKFSEVVDIGHDQFDLVCSCHLHHCNQFCLRSKKNW